MIFILNVLKIDIELLQLYKYSIRYYNDLCNFCDYWRQITTAELLQKFKFKLNQIKLSLDYSLFLGQGIIYLILLSIFSFNEVYIQVCLGVFICLDYIVKDFNYLFKLPILTPSLNLYYPIFFSIFSVTIRITGVLLSLILGVYLSGLYARCSMVMGSLYFVLLQYSVTCSTYY